MRYLMFLLGLLFANVAQAMDCEKVPTCEELGYSTEDDPNCADNGYMYCPFNHEYKKCVNMDCAKLGFTESDKSSWCGKIVKCKGNENYTACKALCEVGDVYYSDGTCGYAEDYDASLGKIPVGVVYYVTDSGRHGKVINLKDLGRESENKPFDPANPYNTKYKLYWGYYTYHVQSLPNYTDDNVLTALQNRDPDLYDGQGNTDKILEDSGPTDCTYDQNTKEYYLYCVPQAARAARDFYPLKGLENDSKVGKGRWYLPALGELMDLYGYDNSQITSPRGTSGAEGNIKTIVNNTLFTLKSKDIVAEKLTAHDYYWSSSQYGPNMSWLLVMVYGERNGKLRSDYEHTVVRVSLEF